jgi:hypothetical protein
MEYSVDEIMRLETRTEPSDICPYSFVSLLVTIQFLRGFGTPINSA